MITALYAIPIAIVFIALSVRVITYRRGNRIGLGDDGDKSLMKRMRAHANCAEYAPFGLLLMFLGESAGATPFMIHIAGLLLLVGRVSHAYGFSMSPPIMKLRVGGMLCTFTSYGLSIATLAVLVIMGQ